MGRYSVGTVQDEEQHCRREKFIEIDYKILLVVLVLEPSVFIVGVITLLLRIIEFRVIVRFLDRIFFITNI